jgi:hypothetical protein
VDWLITHADTTIVSISQAPSLWSLLRLDLVVGAWAIHSTIRSTRAALSRQCVRVDIAQYALASSYSVYVVATASCRLGATLWKLLLLVAQLLS